MNLSTRSGVSAGWNWQTCGSSVWGPPIWSTTPSRWTPWSSCSIAWSAMTISMSRVMRSSTDRPSGEIASADAFVSSMSRRVRARPAGLGSSSRSA
jgi:hypothetical protein